MNVELLLKYIIKKTTNAENQQIEAWLNDSEKNRAYLNEIKTGFEKERAISGYEMADHEIEEGWQHVKVKVHERQALIKSNQKRPGYFWFTRIAAVLIIGLILGIAYRLIVLEGTSVVYKTHQTQASEKQAVTLMDGTKVWLNENSTIHFPEIFEQDRRLVKLEGEGYFEVQRDVERPFIVQLGDIEVAVLGTSFNINQNNPENVKVTVSSGKVAVYTENKNQYVELAKEEIGVYDKQGDELNEGKNTDLNFLSWKTGVLIFKRASMGQIVKDLERHYKLEITCAAEIRQKFTFNGTFDNQPIENVLEVLEAVLDVNIEHRQESIHIK
ncbi:FecR domain-containing protein [Fulvivirgaceae bacterium BMA10]|uniref:FecR domain-containing protein n=1 Tax=Splendidivirga corallicola TaxID=3051826 RepID=A0ABT8KIX8_9BACT|nr:FecR domain-containing protein [Fulvivirgaceae bacterium BMA10]